MPRVVSRDGPTVCVTGGGAGMDYAREQRKLEARRMLENGDESPAVQCRLCWAALVCLRVWVNGIPLWSIWQI
jgi:hypothetical protein